MLGHDFAIRAIHEEIRGFEDCLPALDLHQRALRFLALVVDERDDAIDSEVAPLLPFLAAFLTAERFGSNKR